MPHISVLRKEISELIAAGEVIERPSSVIKEVVENAIDAGAKHITVEIQHGGTTYMRIVDDGCGMAAEEVPTAFLRHATSKISDKADLDHIFTLGFRGEALASIAAVAKVTVLTKRKEDDYGTSYSISGGVAEKSEQTGCPDGTTLLIRDLFYNVPVRQKFMKRDVTEANAVSQIVQKIALSHPEIAFRMIRDNRTEFRTDGSGDLYTAVSAILGTEGICTRPHSGFLPGRHEPGHRICGQAAILSVEPDVSKLFHQRQIRPFPAVQRGSGKRLSEPYHGRKISHLCADAPGSAGTGRRKHSSGKSGSAVFQRKSCHGQPVLCREERTDAERSDLRIPDGTRAAA